MVWWQGLDSAEKKSWEITPDQVKPPQVVVSKRNSLGVLSNFAATPFKLGGKQYASVEGFWQATKYPESSKDPRQGWGQWPHTRQQVEKMTAFKAKRAGSAASKMMQKNQWKWVTYEGQKMLYREQKKGLFYDLIERAMTAKLMQNKLVQNVLCQTRDLELVPDHDQGQNPPPAWQYTKIWMKLRAEKCVNGTFISES